MPVKNGSTWGRVPDHYGSVYDRFARLGWRITVTLGPWPEIYIARLAVDNRWPIEEYQVLVYGCSQPRQIEVLNDWQCIHVGASVGIPTYTIKQLYEKGLPHATTTSLLDVTLPRSKANAKIRKLIRDEHWKGLLLAHKLGDHP